ncbi:hypothetical protein QBC39DRAFT_383917 [Podospora conica]|nr:hypothetical protein QBC39DRAFT_383917 [Schizothecium conicum]
MSCPTNLTTQSLHFRFHHLNALLTNLTQIRPACDQFLVNMTIIGNKTITGLREATAFQIFHQGETSFEWLLNRVGSWTAYEFAIVIGRLIDYKLFLLQLISELPRPRTALGGWGESFAVLHLVADPIDTLSGYLTTLVDCRRTLHETTALLEARIAAGGRPRNNYTHPYSCPPVRLISYLWGFFGRCDPADEIDRQAKVISLVYIAYKTNGHEKSLADLIECEAAHPPLFASAAAALTRDRAANFSPVATAILGMCLSVIFKYVFLDRAAVDEASPQHIDIWSLSSSLVMVHVVPNVLLASVVGVQQSAWTGRRILGGLLEGGVEAGGLERAGEVVGGWQGELEGLEEGGQEAVVKRIREFKRGEGVVGPVGWEVRLRTPWDAEEEIDNAEEENDKHGIRDRQVKDGAVPSFRPDRWRRHPFTKGQHLKNVCIFLKKSWVDILAFVIVSVPSTGGTILAAKVPPEGMNCRAFIKLLMVGTYWVKFAAQIGVNLLSDDAMGALEAIGLRKMGKQPAIVVKMMVTALFDLFALIFFATIIFSTQSGNLSRPGCYCQTVDGVTALFSPKDTWPIVQARMSKEYPGILFGLLGGIVLGVCPALVFSFRHAKDVFLQEDKPWTPGEWRKVLNVDKGDQGTQQEQQPMAPQASAREEVKNGEGIAFEMTAFHGSPV